MNVKIYQVGCYALTVCAGTIIDFELVGDNGGWVPKRGQEFTGYLYKTGIVPIDLTPTLKYKTTPAIAYGGCR
jgi:hypothetical protein